MFLVAISENAKLLLSVLIQGASSKEEAAQHAKEKIPLLIEAHHIVEEMGTSHDYDFNAIPFVLLKDETPMLDRHDTKTIMLV